MSFWDQIAKEKHLLDYPDTPHGPVGFMYPNQYSVGMACLGYQQVYRLMRNAGLSVERVFYDKKRRETRSIENHTPLFRFPFLAASYIYELDIIHLIQMMLHGGVEPLRENRWDDGPLLLLGGTAATANPPLVSRIADAVVLGESEYTIDKIAEIFKQHASLGKKEMLEKLAALDFVYVPAIHGAFDKEAHASYALEPIDAAPCHSAILAESDEFHGAFLLELSRGCKYRCKFCVVHYMSGTARYRDTDLLIHVLEKYANRYHKVGLLGAAVADHPRVADIAEWLVAHNKGVSTSSLRAERLDERLLDALRDGGQKTLTVAPEAGSLDIRRGLLKGVKDEKYFRLAEMAGQRRFQQIKLYFLLGTPNVDPMDEASAIIAFSNHMGEIFGKSGGGKIVVSCSPLVPKPTTPWRDAPMWNPKTIKKASRVIRKKLAFQGNMKVPPINVKEARLEALLSWFGEEAVDELIRIAQTGEPLENAFAQVELDTVRGGDVVSC